MGADDDSEKNDTNYLIDTLGLLVVVSAISVIAGHHYRQYRDYTIIVSKNIIEWPQLRGKTVVITGGSTGVGKETAIVCGVNNSKVIVGCRCTPEAAKKLSDELKQYRCKDDLQRPIDVSVLNLDLTDFKSIRRFAGNIPRCHILINNAGLINRPDDKPMYSNGIEATMLTNYIGHHYLTNLLFRKMENTATASNTQARIVNVTSRLESKANITIDNVDDILIHGHDVTSAAPYNNWKAYSNSKICNLYHTYELSKQLKHMYNGRITCNAVTPGMVHSKLDRNITSTLMQYISYPFKKAILKTPLEGASDVVYVAAADDVTTGQYYASGKVIESSPRSTDALISKKVYDKTQDIIYEQLQRR